MRLEYDLLENDYINFELLHMKHSKIIRKAMKINHYLTKGLFLVVPTTLCILFFIIKDFKNFLTCCILSIFIFCICFSKKCIYKMNKKRLTKVFNKKINEGFFGRYVLEIENNTIKISNEIGVNIIDIFSLKDIIEDEKYIILYLNLFNAIIVPKRVFKNKEEKINFRAFVKI